MIPRPEIAGCRHLVTFSIDDGFLRSTLQMAEVFARHAIPGCFNVLAGDDGSFGGSPADMQIGVPKGDFSLWRQLAADGHEIQPHGWNHTNKAAVPLATAQGLIDRCLRRFTAEMPGFRAERSVFNFPYGASTPELERWLAGRVRACRPGGDGFNPLPHRQLRRISATASGPGDCSAHCEEMIARLLRMPQGWLVYNLHGVDEEGWGPVTVGWLDEVLGRLARMPALAVVPAAMAFASADAPVGAA